MVLGLLAALLTQASPANGKAGRSAKASCDDVGCISEASNVQALLGHRRRPGKRTPSACTIRVLDVPKDTPVYRTDGSVIEVDGKGRWYEKVCKTEAPTARFADPVLGSTYGRGSFTPRESTELLYLRRRSPVPAELAVEALDYLALPAPAVATSPPPEFDSVVRLPVYLTVDAEDWQPRTVTTAVPGVAVTVTAVPQQVEWAMGNGDIVVCAGPGTPYDFSRPEDAQVADCTYRYDTTSIGQPHERFTVTATVVWRASWSVVGAPGGGDLGEVRRSATTSLRVVQVQTVNVN